MTVFWAGAPHQVLKFQGLTGYFVVTIPLVWFLQWHLPDHFTQPILHGATVVEPDAGRLATDRARFQSWIEDARIASEERRHVSLLEIEARLHTLIHRSAPD